MSYSDPVVAGVVQGRRDFLKIGRDVFTFNQPVVQLVPVSGREVVIAVVTVEEQNLGYLVFQEQGNNRPVVGSLQKIVGIRPARRGCGGRAVPTVLTPQSQTYLGLRKLSVTSVPPAFLTFWQRAGENTGAFFLSGH